MDMIWTRLWARGAGAHMRVQDRTRVQDGEQGYRMGKGKEHETCTGTG